MRIKADVVPRIVYAGNVRALDALHHGLLHPLGDNDLRAALVRQLFQRIFIGEPERRRKKLRAPLRIVDGVGAGVDGIGGDISRKQLPVRVIDISPSCRNGDLARPLIEGAGVEIVLPDDLDIEKACKKKAKKKGYRHRHGK